MLTVSDTVSIAAVNSINTGYAAHLDVGALTVSDTASAVVGDVSTLQTLAAKLNSVTVADVGTTPSCSNLAGLLTAIDTIDMITLSESNTPLVVTSAQLATYGTVFDTITTYKATVSDTVATTTVDSINTHYASHLATGALTVSDTSANVNGDLTTLEALGSKLNTVTITDTATTVQAVAIAAGLATFLSGTIAVSDTGASILSSLSGLLTNVGKIGTITVSNGETPLVVTSTQLSTYGTVFAKIPAYFVTVCNTIATATVDSINTTYNGHLATGALTVSDTAANVNGDLTTLEGLGSKLNTVAITGNATAAQAVAIAAGLSGYLSGAINVSDLGTGIVAVLPGLLTSIAKIGTITVSNSQIPMVVTSTQLATDGTVLAKITTYSVTVSNTIATTTVDSIATQYNGHLATSALTVFDTAANVYGDLTTLAGLGSKLHTVTVSDTVTATQAGAIATGLNPYIAGQIVVTDTAAKMMANIDALQILATGSKLGALTITTAAPALNATVAQVNSDSTAINAVMGATGANANAILYIQGTSSGDTINVTGLTHTTDIALGSNNATMSFVSNVGTVSGVADTVTLGSAASTVEYTVNSGVEVISGFQFGTDVLRLSLGSVNVADFAATDVMVNNVSGIALTVSDYPTQGVILLSTGISAATLTNDHASSVENHFLIS